LKDFLLGDRFVSGGGPPKRPSDPLTSNLKWADAPGNVLLPARSTSLSKDSVANVSQIVAVDKSMLSERVGKLSSAKVDLLFAGIDVVLDR
jgi:mRNA interferase MazF